MWVPKNGRIRASTRKNRIRACIEKLIGWVSGKGPINVITYKWHNPGEYQEKIESVRVSKNCSGEYWERVQSMWVPKNGIIRVSTKKKWNPYEYRKTVRVSSGKGSNQCEYLKMAESEWVPRKSWIRASIQNLFGWVPEKGPINVRT